MMIPPPAMNGKDYRALRRLSTADDRTLAEVGETCERVPAESLSALLASQKIARVTPADKEKPYARR